MKILSPFTIFGFDLFSVLGQKKQADSINILGGISFLQSFKYFISKLGDKKQNEKGEELDPIESEFEEIGGVFAKRIVEDHIVSTAGHNVSQDIVQELTKDTFIQVTQTSVSPTYSEIDTLSSLMEIPQDILGIMQEKEYGEDQI